ncbi:hypothetical protein WR25_19960 [Diploscapter pachys]|uniref:glutaminase n=1 Tax=Diploscapter pachys TaxID=2018661 RepID=A0A2A2KV44_9BILA|nr:hypothetical protein WR25_19960 [Diploscapter pachys]
MGIALWAPPLDKMGNSCKGVAFCRKLIEKFNFHNYDSLLHADSHKIDPRRRVVGLLFAAKNGDIDVVKRLYMQGTDLDIADYDGRTALHIAASEGHAHLVRFFLNVAKVYHEPRDRWGRTPLDDAKMFHHDDCVELLMIPYMHDKMARNTVVEENEGTSELSMSESDDDSEMQIEQRPDVLFSQVAGKFDEWSKSKLRTTSGVVCEARDNRNKVDAVKDKLAMRRPLGEHPNNKNTTETHKTVQNQKTKEVKESGKSTSSVSIAAASMTISGKSTTSVKQQLQQTHTLVQAYANPKYRKAVVDVVGFDVDIFNYLLTYEKSEDFAVDNMYILSTQLQPKMRSILIDWIVQVQQRFSLLPDTLHLTVFLLDKFLSVARDVTKTELQLVGTTCMFIASKFEEMYPPVLSDFEYMADNAFAKRDIIRMEMRILDAVGFNLGRPNSLQFLEWYCIALGVDMKKVVIQRARYFNEASFPTKNQLLILYRKELCLLDASLAHLYPSQVSAASLHLALHVAQEDDVSKQMAKLAKMTDEEMKTIAELCAGAIIRVMSQQKLAAMRTKYQSSKFNEASKMSQTETEHLRSLIPRYDLESAVTAKNHGGI